VKNPMPVTAYTLKANTTPGAIVGAPDDLLARPRRRNPLAVGRRLSRSNSVA
jgi:hypothetical protein